ncbi:argininosuccinate lyase [Fusobacterium necrogenes]|uniref:argininosuccinate lyase n=1 Tax=Fusobacterium necrogenes TaxID=858 RepID=UPI00255CF4CC|nr:argininosuccinate lyase [Fusobacterium necrogenes]
MQFFSGRFKEKASHLILDFHSSISFDKRLYKYDIMGSIAHVRGLGKQGIISLEDSQLIERTLKDILRDIEAGKIEFSIEYEDIHMNIEKILIDRIGDVGKKLHTGRSRNDQVAVDMKLFTKDEVVKIQALLLDLLEVINSMAKENLSTYMPGFTHLQKAQPVSFAHYILAYAEMFRRDYIRLSNAISLADTSPLGSAALAGTTYPLDRQFTASQLGFSAPTWNSMDSVSDRDYLIEIINAFSLIMVHLSRFCEEIIIFSSNDYGYIELSDSFSTGSSIMPQKKNPDAAELIRGKSGRVFGDLMALLTTMKGIPLAYNKDMQEDKENFFDALDTVKACLNVFIGMFHTLTVKKENMLLAASQGFINATDVADFLTEKGMSFRDAYKIVGSMVTYCIDNNTTFENLTLENYKNFSELFDNDIYEAISIKNCVEKRTTLGGPGEESVLAHIEFLDKFILDSEKHVNEFKLNNILD